MVIELAIYSDSITECPCWVNEGTPGHGLPQCCTMLLDTRQKENALPHPSSRFNTHCILWNAEMLQPTFSLCLQCILFCSLTYGSLKQLHNETYYHGITVKNDETKLWINITHLLAMLLLYSWICTSPLTFDFIFAPPDYLCNKVMQHYQHSGKDLQSQRQSKVQFLTIFVL